MPELPEVETTCRGIRPHIENKIVHHVVVRRSDLRWPVPGDLSGRIEGLSIERVDRRAKYLLLETENGTLIVHLGMSGSLRVVTAEQAVKKHDHIDLVFTDQTILRFNDPRRFGAVLWTAEPIETHTLLRDLGPEPLQSNFDGTHLYQTAKNRSIAVKSFIMDSHVVVGVGNIYANEALFMAGIRPDRAAGNISKNRYDQLADCIREVLSDAIEQGGTTLRDFVNESGKPGYFQQQLRVYGRGGEPCRNCLTPLNEIRIANRSTVYCRRCQT
ncbi:MAG: bifunctional DNA-formamidopyrimidine glycosylase/DNA-(apurinic or apyrimidinic site) lyase [Methylomicrobium sp.]